MSTRRLPPLRALEAFVRIVRLGSAKAAANELGLDWSRAMFGGVARVYKKYFAVEYEEIDRCPDIDFVQTPEWLEKKRLK